MVRWIASLRWAGIRGSACQGQVVCLGSRRFLRENLVLSSAVMSSLCSSHNLHELSPQHPGDTHESRFIKAITLKWVWIHYSCLRSIFLTVSGFTAQGFSGVMIYEIMYDTYIVICTWWAWEEKRIIETYGKQVSYRLHSTSIRWLAVR